MTQTFERIIALRFLAKDRKIFRFKATKHGDFYVFFPQSTNPALAGFPLHRHVSYHASGRHHFKVADSSGPLEVPAETRADRQPTAGFRGVELLTQAPLFKPFVEDLPVVAEGPSKVLVLDADGAGFRNDVLFVRVYLVEPGRLSEIPVPAYVGPRVFTVIQVTIPWVAIEVFQQQAAAIPAPPAN